MKWLANLFFLLLFSIGLISCAESTQTPTPSVEVIGPGDNVGEMSVVQGTYPRLFYPYIWQYCEFLLTGTEPVNLSSDCSVPNIPGLVLSFGWFAEEEQFESSWEAISIEFYVDGYPLALDEFGWEDEDSPEIGPNVKSRFIILYLENLTEGQHTFKISISTDIPVDNGFEVMQPGVQEHIINFTVSDPEIYPILSFPVSTGQHSYSSEESGFNYLLFVPDDYEGNPQQQWPLILYLHGMDKLNSTLESLEADFLPETLEHQGDIPFIVVSPLAISQSYEFWQEEEMVDSLLILLEEIQTILTVDPNRIYLTGESSGGNGTWDIGLQHPDYFAALIPIMGYHGWPFTIPENICSLRGTPVWAFHGAQDEVVPLESAQQIVEALEACGGNVQFTIFPENGHDIEVHQIFTSELFSWLLEHTRD